MTKNTILKNLTRTLFALALVLTTFSLTKLDTQAVSFPSINVTFDSTDESVIVDGIPASDSSGAIEYQLEGYLNYEKERVSTFCYAPNVRPYDVPGKMAYIFNWSGDAEFLLPCSGDYTFTAYVTARYIDAQGNGVEDKGPKTTINITLHKQDESTNWGPGLPNTTVETYDLKQIKGKNKSIIIEEPEYTWTINGSDIETVPEKNLSLKVTANPDTFPNEGVDEFFGDTLALKFNIEHNGEFGFRAILDYKIGTEYTGKYANLFYVAGEGVFEYVSGAIVDESGIATFPFTHASDYVLAVTDVEYTGQELNPKVEEPTTETDEETTTSGETTSTEESTTSDEDSTTESSASTEETPSSETGSESLTESSDIPTTEETSQTQVADTSLTLWIIVGSVILIAVIIVILMFVKKKK